MFTHAWQLLFGSNLQQAQRITLLEEIHKGETMAICFLNRVPDADLGQKEFVVARMTKGKMKKSPRNDDDIDI